MRVLILGIDGYLGWPLAQHLLQRRHEISGVDAGYRREWVATMGSDSAIPIASLPERVAVAAEQYRQPLTVTYGDVTCYQVVAEAIQESRPDAIVHLAECPSAPFSMIDNAHAQLVMRNNLGGTLNLLHAMRDLCPEAHLIKLATMGEYGTPNLDIPEGSFDIEYRGRRDTLPFPRQAGSWYHWTKVWGSQAIQFACKVWGLRATDVHQGVVYGTRVPGLPYRSELATRLDYDEAFGTCLNRFCCQAVVGEPLTVYGEGGQTRGFLSLGDSIQCLRLALENPLATGYRVLNQFESTYSVLELAKIVREVGWVAGLTTDLYQVENPRQEAEQHYYQPDHQKLFDLGYVPDRDINATVLQMLKDLLPHKERIWRHREGLLPEIRWDGRRRRSGFLKEHP